MHLATASGGVTRRLVADVCAQVGVNSHLFHQLFPSEGTFLDAINDLLVDECASRLREGVSQFHPSGDEDDFRRASVALADSRPLTRSGVLIRESRRMVALETNADGELVAKAERRYVGALVDVFVDLMGRLGRTFAWPPILAVRVILDTYERSFEMWLICGHDEVDFGSSPYVQNTLPSLLRHVSDVAPMSRAASMVDQ